MASTRQRLLMDFGWKFALGSAGDAERDFGYGTGFDFAKAGSCGGPAALDFDDSNWRSLDLPHDWAVELPLDRRARMDHGFRAVGPNFPENSIGWYRKVFALSPRDAARRLSVEFDGVYRDCQVFFNGHYVGRNLCGYNSFRFDLSDLTEPGRRNVLAVRVDASKTEGWFYEGAGIYRHVWLTKTDPLHVGHWGAFVSSTVGRNAAKVTARVTVDNDADTAADCRLTFTLVNARGAAVARGSGSLRVGAWSSRQLTQRFTVRKPRLWSLEAPYLYRLVTRIHRGRALVDEVETPFGIRTVTFSARTGFALNGRRMKLKGVCCHQDHAGVGAALPDALQEFRIRRLKEMGCNAYRSAHNPPTPELLDACDRLGMLVMDECRHTGTSADVLDELESLVRRDRNHPSVILWSLGNEEGGIQGTNAGARVAATMYRLVKKLDPTRAVTVAMNGAWGKGFSRVVDVQGCNYIHCGAVDAFHRRMPDKPVLYSEAASTLTTRGQYENDKKKCYVSAYDVNHPVWGAAAERMWKHNVARPWLGGTFVWTGFDYRGEPTPYRHWPCINSHFGILDTCGFAKDSFYYYKAWWGRDPVVHILPHWNRPARRGRPVDVWVHTNCREVELILNGQSLGVRRVEPQGHLEWRVPYEPGILEARGYNAGRPAADDVVETTGPPAAILLLPDRTKVHADCEDAVPVTAAVIDARGRIVPTASNDIRFAVSRGARILGVGNGNPSSHEADKADRRKAFNGLCQVIVQATDRAGAIRLTARSKGLKSARAIIGAKASRRRPYVPPAE